jgi:hypothetical protein
MHTDEEYRQIFELWEQGKNKKRISIVTGINRSTVRDCVNHFQFVQRLDDFRANNPTAPMMLRLLHAGNVRDNQAVFEAYGYLLGLYLGDGYISPSRKTYRLRVACDAHYSESCMGAMRTILPRNQEIL